MGGRINGGARERERGMRVFDYCEQQFANEFTTIYIFKGLRPTAGQGPTHGE